MDSYISVNSSGISVSKADEVTELWNGSRPDTKAGTTRTYFKDGKVIVAVSTGKDVVAGKGEKSDNKLKELSRRK